MLINTDFDLIVFRSRERANNMVTSGLYSRFGLSQSGRFENALIGCVGELAFEEYLKANNIKYETDNTDFSSKNSDEFDFLINAKKIDIKVAKKTTKNSPNDNWGYGYPEEQNPSSKDFVVVGWVDFEKKEISFYGWLTGNEIKEYPVVTHNSFVGFKYKTPNHEFKWGDMNKDFKNLIEQL